MKEPSYLYEKTLAMPSFDEAVILVRAALEAEGFGIVSAVDVSAALRDELGLDFRRYVILGACNPSLAHQALQADPHVGLRLLCHVVIQESYEDARVLVSIADPKDFLRLGDNAVVDSLALAVDQSIHRVIRSLN